MASSKKLQSDDLPDFVAGKLKQWACTGRRLTLALSGGVDSVVLLDILAQLRTTLDFLLSALYVNHQISPNAPAWGRFCAQVCACRDVPYTEETVTLDQNIGASLEALARDARYRVFSRHDTDFIVLAQHLDDQAETLLLQLLRGAGLKGLSCMAGVRGQESGIRNQDSEKWIIRPLLEVSREVILGYARYHGLSWVEDESNLDVGFDRNFLRHAVLPVFSERFPAYRETFARATRHFAEAAGLLEELAVIDAGGSIRENRLGVSVLRRLSLARAKNLLRYFLNIQGVPMPSAVRLDDILRQLTDARPDAHIHILLGEFELRRYRDVVYVMRKRGENIFEYALPWRFEHELALPFGLLSFERRQGEGISLARLSAKPVSVRNRRGGERLRPVCGRPSRSLKNLLQESAVPPWRRECLPLLFCGEELVFVPEVGVDCAYRANPGEESVLAIFILESSF